MNKNILFILMIWHGVFTAGSNVKENYLGTNGTELEDICDETIISKPSQYVEGNLFRTFKLEMVNENKIQKHNLAPQIEFKYADHISEIESYLTKLKEVQEKRILNSNIKLSSENYYRSKILALAQALNSFMDDVSNDIPEILAPEKFYRLEDDSYPKYYLENLERDFKLMNDHFEVLYFTEHISFTEDLKQFAYSEIDRVSETIVDEDKDIDQPLERVHLYFREELCDLLTLLPELVNYSVKNDLEDQSLEVFRHKDKLQKFYKIFIDFNRSDLKCEQSEEKFIEEFLKIIHKNENIESIQKTGAKDRDFINDQFFKNIADVKDTKDFPKTVNFDNNMTHLHKNIKKIDLPFYRELDQHKRHYSHDFLMMLDDIHDKNQQKDDLLKNIYKLYVIARNSDEIPHDFSTDKIEILKKLMEILNSDKFNPEKDSVDDEIPHNDLRQVYEPIVALMNEQIKNEDTVYDIFKEQDDNNENVVLQKMKDFHKDEGNVKAFIEKFKSVIPAEILNRHKKEVLQKEVNYLEDIIEMELDLSSEEDPEDLLQKEDDPIVERLIRKTPRKQGAASPVENIIESIFEVDDNDKVTERSIDTLLDKIDKPDRKGEINPKKQKLMKKLVVGIIKRMPSNIKKPELWKKINVKLIERLMPNVNNVEGFYKLLRWTLRRPTKEFFYPYDDNLNEPDTPKEKKLKKIYNKIIEKQTYLMNVDNTLFVVNIKRDHDHLGRETMAYYERLLHKNNNYVDFYNNEILASEKFFLNFHKFEFFFEILKVFHLFDKV